MALCEGLNPEARKTPFDSIGSAIKHYRLRSKLSQQQLATKLGVCQASVSHYEYNRVCPPLKIIQKLSRELNVPIQLLCSHSWKVL